MNLKKPTLLILFFCTIKLLIHVIADSDSGFQGDEFLHIETGHHLDWGFMEFPPVIGLLACIQNLFHSQSVFVNHLFAHIASLFILMLVTLITQALGGQTKAVFMALLFMLVAPCFGRSQQLFQPVVFSQFFWLLSFYQLVRFVTTLNKKYLLYLTLSFTAGFLTKYDMVFFGAGLAGLLFFERTRTAILTKSSWRYIFLFLIFAGPNIWWQYQHHFPVFAMFSRLYEVQLNHLTVAGVIKDLIITLNPFTAVLWLAGAAFMFNSRYKTTWRPVAVCIVLSICFLALGKSKAYYFYPAVITLFVFGSIWFEQNILTQKAWVIYPVSALFIISGALMMPLGLAVLPLNTFISYAHLGKGNGRYPIDCDEFYSPYKWDKTLAALQSVYDSLPANEQKDCLIWGKHYSQAGAVDFYKSGHQLPSAFSLHGSFYLWAPDGPMPQTVIAFTNGEAGIDFFEPFFETVVAVKQVYNPYADFDKDLWQTIYICKKPRQTFSVLKQEFRNRIFE